tara:strand:+ start:1583 stop:3361 length:1779 start_codon:yes stop_codon:yes gene_type:complete
MNFTPEQEAAIESSLVQNTYIPSTAGSGKSTTLARIAKELMAVPNNRVLLITFTNKSAKDIINKAGGQQYNIMGGTFHSIAYKIMRESHGIDDSICDEGKKKLIIRKLFDCKKDKARFTEIYDIISEAKSKYPVVTNETIHKYDSELDKYNMMDFDDIINICIDLLYKKGSKLKTTHILVDELQDTSQSQLELLKAIRNTTNANVVGVGDLDQCIYEFRGARPENVNDFISMFDCKTKPLGLNFRSKTNIVDNARKLIEHNIYRLKIDIRAFDSSYGIVHCFQGKSPEDEIEYTISLCKQKRHQDITILYRSRTYKMQLEFMLRKNRLNYTVNDSTEIVDRSAFKVTFCMMKIASGKYDIYDMEEAAKGMKSLGQSTIDKIKELETTRKIGKPGDQLDLFSSARNINNFNDLVHDIRDNDKKVHRSTTTLAKTQKLYEDLNEEGATLSKLVEGLQDHMINSFDMPKEIYDFVVDICSEYECTNRDIYELCNEFGLDNKKEVQDEDARIELSTIHGYKGGEADVVIMPFCDWKMREDDRIKDVVESERRLFYVAVTRAKQELYLTYSNEVMPRFLQEMGLGKIKKEYTGIYRP